MNAYRLAADAVLILHATFVAFVVFGLLLVIVGWARGWKWVRNVWFRGGHLLAIATVVAQSWAGVPCPLTTLEGVLRRRAGESFYSEGFVAHWLHRVIFYEAEPWVFGLCYTIFGGLVVVTWVVCPPRRPRRRGGAGEAHADGEPPTNGGRTSSEG